MNLDFNQIKEVTSGVLEVKNNESGIVFLRHTEKQTAFWSSYREVLGERSLTTTDVRLDFLTDATSVIFDICHRGKYELFIDGKFSCQVNLTGNCKYTYVIKPSQDGELHRVTFYLPSHNRGSINGVEIEGGEIIKKPEYPVNFLFLGDSITQGWNAKYDTNSFAIRLSRKYGANSLNQGVGGAIFAPNGFDELNFNPDVVFVAYGTNDFVHFKGPGDDFKKAMRGYLDAVKNAYSEKEVFVITPIYRFFDEGENKDGFEELCSEIAKESDKRGFKTIDGFELVPHDRTLYDDNVHPNDAGFEYFAENLDKVVRQTVRKLIRRGN